MAPAEANLVLSCTFYMISSAGMSIFNKLAVQALGLPITGNKGDGLPEARDAPMTIICHGEAALGARYALVRRDMAAPYDAIQWERQCAGDPVGITEDFEARGHLSCHRTSRAGCSTL